MSSLQHFDVTMSLKLPKKALKKHYEINSYDLCNIFLLRASKVIIHWSYLHLPCFFSSKVIQVWNEMMILRQSIPFIEKMQTISNNKLRVIWQFRLDYFNRLHISRCRNVPNNFTTYLLIKRTIFTAKSENVWKGENERIVQKQPRF